MFGEAPHPELDVGSDGSLAPAATLEDAPPPPAQLRGQPLPVDLPMPRVEAA